MKYLGIDFGTVWTKACIYDTDTRQFNMVNMDEDSSERSDFELIGGKFACPTAVYFDQNDITRVGKEAARSRFINPLHFFNLFKPLLSNPENIKAQELSETVIAYVYNKAIVQNNNHPFDSVTITVPASTIEHDVRWNRMSTIMNKLNISNYNIIREPEAAGYYILSDSIKNDTLKDGEVILVYDFGGGTFDPALIEVRGKTIRIIGEWDFNKGREVGGIYIDNIIQRDIIDKVDLFREEVIEFFASIPRDETGRPVIDTNNKQFVRDYRNAFSYRDQLAQLQVATKHFFSLFHDSSFSRATPSFTYSLNREDYYELILPIINETIHCCDDLVAKYGGWNIVSKIILVGGSSLIPLVKDRLLEKRSDESLKYEICFPEIKNDSNTNILYAVAIGASLFESLQPTADERILFGKEALRNSDFAEAEYQFAKANSLYWLSIMMYEGLGQNKHFKEIHNCYYDRFKDCIDKGEWTSDDLKLFVLHYIMLFKGEGLIKNDDRLQMEISSFRDLTKSKNKKKVEKTITDKIDLLTRLINESASPADIRTLYNPIFHRM